MHSSASSQPDANAHKLNPRRPRLPSRALTNRRKNGQLDSFGRPSLPASLLRFLLYRPFLPPTAFSRLSTTAGCQLLAREEHHEDVGARLRHSQIHSEGRAWRSGAKNTKQIEVALLCLLFLSETKEKKKQTKPRFFLFLLVEEKKLRSQVPHVPKKKGNL